MPRPLEAALREFTTLNSKYGEQLKQQQAQQAVDQLPEETPAVRPAGVHRTSVGPVTQPKR